MLFAVYYTDSLIHGSLMDSTSLSTGGPSFLRGFWAQTLSLVSGTHSAGGPLGGATDSISVLTAAAAGVRLVTGYGLWWSEKDGARAVTGAPVRETSARPTELRGEAVPPVLL